MKDIFTLDDLKPPFYLQGFELELKTIEFLIEHFNEALEKKLTPIYFNHESKYANYSKVKEEDHTHFMYCTKPEPIEKKVECEHIYRDHRIEKFDTDMPKIVHSINKYCPKCGERLEK